MLKKLVRTLPVVLLCLAFALPVAAKGITLRSADTHDKNYPTVQAVLYMGKLLDQWTDGRIKIKVFSGRQLGEEKATIEQTIAGVIDLDRVNLAPLNGFIPETAIPALPYIFRSTEHMHKVMDGEIGQEILAAMAPHGLIGLAFYDSGARSFYNSKRPIKSPADMVGMKIRVQNSDLFVATIEALGAKATPMEFGQVYEALKTGVIDGAENNWPSYESTRHFEVAKYYSLDQHSMSPEVLVMSKRSWDRLSKDDQALVRKAAIESVAVMRDLWNQRVEKSKKVVMAAGNDVIEDIDKQPFIDAMGPVYDRFANTPELKRMVKRIQAVQ
ncbi:TRAP transporter substrate-binding protein [Pelobacter seleniigenes]|uniref:TRAP transporter substrate-binding protein n=1 Tax=Pelobacter seleniigenes TaxID=407188 RepID=UPI0004A6C89F|nr:TRAP transporter substrate-binding protein [Pelobacter seleniigenes]